MKCMLILSALLVAVSGVFALSVAPPTSLDERVATADLVFVGEVVNRVEKEQWVHAELLVKESILGAGDGALVPVIWRKSASGIELFDVANGREAIALLGDYMQGRYILRGDRFVALEQLDEVRTLSKEPLFDAQK